MKVPAQLYARSAICFFAGRAFLRLPGHRAHRAVHHEHGVRERTGASGSARACQSPFGPLRKAPEHSGQSVQQGTRRKGSQRCSARGSARAGPQAPQESPKAGPQEGPERRHGPGTVLVSEGCPSERVCARKMPGRCRKNSLFCSASAYAAQQFPDCAGPSSRAK